MNPDDLFVTIAPEVPRDGYKRPLIVPPGGGTPVPYTRASTFANALDDAPGLTIWKLRNLALGIGRHEDLAAMLAGLTYEADKNKIDEIVETAIDRAGGTAKANWGTAVHMLTEPDAQPYAPARMRADIDAYNAKLADHGITVVATERFTVNDDLRVAGTFDHVFHIPGLGNVVGDKKSGKLHLLACAIQLATYATGAYYRLDTDGTAIREALPNVRTDKGIIAHIPAGEGRCDLHVVDLTVGMEAARLALAVRDMRARGDIAALLELEPEATGVTPEAIPFDIDDAIATAPDRAALERLYAEHAAAWTDEHTELTKARLALLAGGLVA